MLLTVEDVASELQLTRLTIYRMIEREELTFFKVGKGLRIEDVDLQKYIEAQKKEAETKRKNAFKKAVKAKKLKVIV